MARTLSVLVGFCVLFGACTQKMICPAYQSAFIYDKDELRKKYSYFKEDSTPKMLTASKTKYLIAVPESYRKKVRGMATVPMKQLNPVVPDSLIMEQKDNFEDSDFSLAERDVDSTAAQQPLDSAFTDESLATDEDSVYVITKDREIRVLRYNFPDSLKFDPATGKYVPEKPYYYVEHVGYNTEQDNYMWYLRDAIVLPDVKLAKMAGENQGEGGAGGSGKKKRGGFFKNLFKKKNKKKEESLVEDQLVPEEEKELDFNDLDNPPSDSSQVTPSNQTKTATQQPAQETSKKKKGGLFKKKEKTPKKKKEEPVTEKKEEDDGF